MRESLRRERRVVIIFWLTVATLILGSFAAEGLLRQQVCMSAMVADYTGSTVYPEVCT